MVILVIVYALWRVDISQCWRCFRTMEPEMLLIFFLVRAALHTPCVMYPNFSAKHKHIFAPSTPSAWEF